MEDPVKELPNSGGRKTEMWLEGNGESREAVFYLVGRLLSKMRVAITCFGVDGNIKRIK